MDEGGSACDGAAVAEGPHEDPWNWERPDELSMHPFWAVKRMTEKQMKAAIAAPQKNSKQPALPLQLPLDGADFV